MSFSDFSMQFLNHKYGYFIRTHNSYHAVSPTSRGWCCGTKGGGISSGGYTATALGGGGGGGR